KRKDSGNGGQSQPEWRKSARFSPPSPAPRDAPIPGGAGRARGRAVSRPLAVRLAGLGDLLDELFDLLGLAPAQASRDVGLRDDADETVLFVNDREATDLLPLHEADHLLFVGVGPNG